MPAAFDRLAEPPLFITGHSRSGTTWTLDIFDRHPEVCAIFETWLLTRSNGVTGVFAQPQWVPEFYEAQLESLGLPHAAVQLLSYDEMARELGELVARWLVRPVRPEHRFLVEKGPLDVEAAATLFPEARFVHVLRDGRDVALSMTAASETWDPAMGRGLSMRTRARDWRRGVEAILTPGRALGARYLEIRFEDLKLEFEATARTLFDFAGIPCDDAQLAAIRNQTQLASYSENVIRSGFRGQGPPGGWRERFSLRDAIEFDLAAGELLVSLGYEHDRRWWRALMSPRRRRR